MSPRLSPLRGCVYFASLTREVTFMYIVPGRITSSKTSNCFLFKCRDGAPASRSLAQDRWVNWFITCTRQLFLNWTARSLFSAIAWVRLYVSSLLPPFVHAVSRARHTCSFQDDALLKCQLWTGVCTSSRMPNCFLN